MMVTVRLTSSNTTPRARAMKSRRAKGRRTYQVRLLPLPKPRSSIALEMTSMRLRLVKISGNRMLTEFFNRLKNGSLRPSSTPRFPSVSAPKFFSAEGEVPPIPCACSRWAATTCSAPCRRTTRTRTQRKPPRLRRSPPPSSRAGAACFRSLCRTSPLRKLPPGSVLS